MSLQCPHCHTTIEFEGKPPPATACPSCGSTIQIGPGSTAGWLPEGAPRRLGKFEFLEQLGVGTFGAVYKARDVELGRTVAIKIPRAGNVASQQELDRFLREARSAAQLTHPGIVTLHDASSIDGTCCLVSEFIQGSTLSERLSGQRFTFRQAAELIAQVADALHYAHQHGVIHRDLKPSNVMLDMEGRPHLMDFGLAKRTTDETTMTLDGQVLGTPAYMSPEQARGEGKRVDARTDVYGLGVVLYELLTGELPFRGQTRMLLVQVMQDEPRPPRRLNDRIPRDLETICLKAMAKEPARRYQSAGALAEDLRRFLNGDAILARPTGQVEKAWRVCRRNPIATGLTGALLLVLAGGAGLSTVLWLHARANYQDAEKKRARADENFREALQAVEDYFNKVTRNKLLDSKLPGMQPFRKELMESALRYYERFAEKHADDPALRLEIAKAYGRMGSVTALIGSQEQGLAQLAKARDLLLAIAAERPGDDEVRLPLATTYHHLGYAQVRVGRALEGVASARQAVALQRHLLAKAPADVERRREMARACNGLGQALEGANVPVEAIAVHQEGIALLEALVREHPDEADYLTGLAGMHHNVGVIHQDTLRQPTEALAAFQIALELEEQALAKAPHDVWIQDFLAKHVHSMGVARDVGLKQFDEALELYERAAGLREKLVRENPAVHEFRAELAFSYRAIGRLRRIRGDRDHAARAFDLALPLLESLSAEQPTTPEYRRVLALTYTSLGHLHGVADDLAAAHRCHTRAVALQEKLARDNPGRLLLKGHLVLYLANLGSVQAHLDQLADARQSLGEMLAILNELNRVGFKDVDFEPNTEARQAQKQAIDQAIARAEASLVSKQRELADELAKLAAQSPDIEARLRVIGLQTDCFRQLWRLGRKDEALQIVQASTQLVEQLLRERPDELEFHRVRMSCAVHTARVLRDLKRREEAVQAARQAVAAWDARLSGKPERLADLASTQALCSTLLSAGRTQLNAEEAAERARLEDLAMKNLQEALDRGFNDVRYVKHNLDFEPLHKRDDFKALVRGLQEKAKTKDNP